MLHGGWLQLQIRTSSFEVSCKTLLQQQHQLHTIRAVTYQSFMQSLQNLPLTVTHATMSATPLARPFYTLYLNRYPSNTWPTRQVLLARGAASIDIAGAAVWTKLWGSGSRGCGCQIRFCRVQGSRVVGTGFRLGRLQDSGTHKREPLRLG